MSRGALQSLVDAMEAEQQGDLSHHMLFRHVLRPEMLFKCMPRAHFGPYLGHLGPEMRRIGP